MKFFIQTISDGYYLVSREINALGGEESLGVVNTVEAALRVIANREMPQRIVIETEDSF